ncbi:hypothetical protein [Parafrankia discariae]|uniref:hypothetical protein n=1 Tax=Parafrankia discariae TaxID=365528 RepID=UPI0012B69424|nr:hypothetical protein [Parafrankia discariae]
MSPTDRRDLLRLGTLGVTTPAIAAALDVAARASAALAAESAAVSPVKLAQLEGDATAIAVRYWSTPLDELLPVVLDRLSAAITLLDSRLRLDDRTTVTRLAGTYAYYASRIGGHIGRPELAPFGALAAQYADQANDPILTGSIAGNRSCAAREAGRFDEAADIAGRAIPGAHPYVRPRLAAYQAVALGAAGRHDEALDVLRLMAGAPAGLPPAPGAGLWDEGEELVYGSLTYAEIGRAAEVRPRVAEALSGLPAEEFQARALVTFAGAQVLAVSDPGAAAAGGLETLALDAAWPTQSVRGRVARLHRSLTLSAPDADGVAELGRALAGGQPCPSWL